MSGELEIYLCQHLRGSGSSCAPRLTSGFGISLGVLGVL